MKGSSNELGSKRDEAVDIANAATAPVINCHAIFIVPETPFEFLKEIFL